MNKQSNEQQSKFGGLKSSDLILDDPIERNFYQNSNVEFPIYCRNNWNKLEEVSAARLGTQIQPCWQSSYKYPIKTKTPSNKKQKIVFDKMPYLNADEFSEFYRCIVEGDKQEIQEQKGVIKLG